MACKNLAKYLFDEKIGKKYLKDICSMKEWSDKNAILNFFLGTTQLLFTSNSILVRTIFHVFPNIHSKIWKFLHHLFPWERSKRYEGVMKNMRNNFFMSSIFCLKMYPPWSTAEKIGRDCTILQCKMLLVMKQLITVGAFVLLSILKRCLDRTPITCQRLGWGGVPLSLTIFTSGQRGCYASGSWLLIAIHLWCLWKDIIFVGLCFLLQPISIV